MIEVTQLDVTRRSPKTSSSLLRIGPRHGADTRGGEAAPRLLGGALLERIETAAGLDQLADSDERLSGVGEEAQGSGFLKAIAATAPASGASHSWAAEKLPSDSSRKPSTWLPGRPRGPGPMPPRPRGRLPRLCAHPPQGRDRHSRAPWRSTPVRAQAAWRPTMRP